MRTQSRVAAVALAVAAVVCAFAAPAGAAKPPPPPPPPPPTYSFAQCQTTNTGVTELCVTVNREPATANPDTSATVTVTVTCTSTDPTQVYYGNVRVLQDNAAHADQVLVGSPQEAFPCTGTPRTHVITTRPMGFHPGFARVIAQISTQGSQGGGATTVQVDTGDAVVLA